MCTVLRGGRVLIDEIIPYEKNARHNEKAMVDRVINLWNNRDGR